MSAPGVMSDAAARERARTVFDRPLVVEAGAGTGKTTTLIARICTWCVGPGWDLAARAGGDESAIAARTLDGVVAITFTEAAAAEMAGRFGSALVEVAAGRPVVGIPTLPVPSDVAQVRARALLGAVDRLVVSTIHAYCARVLGAAPTEAGLHPAHRVDADGTLLAEVVHEVVVDWFTEIFTTPEGAERVDGVERERLVLLAERGIGSEEIVGALTLVASEAVPPSALEAEVYTPAAVQGLLRHVVSVLSAWLRPVSECLRGATVRVDGAKELVGALTRLYERGRRAEPTLETVRALAAAAEEVDTKRLREWARGKFQSTEGKLFGRAKDEVAAASRDAVRLVQHLQVLQPDLLEAARGVLAPLLARVQAELRRRGVVSFTQLLRGARDLLVRDERLRQRFRGGMTQLLVDEFQDTDDLQCDLVRMLALEGEQRPGLFLVGDPKQSIYGWRSADLVAYQTFVDRVVADGGELLRLDVNRRSLAPILDEVERVITEVMRFESGYQAAFQPLHSARAGEPGPEAPWAPVEHWLSWEVDERGSRVELRSEEVARLEARAIAADVTRLRAETGISWEKIGVLFRSTGDLEVYLNAFREAGIPFVVERNRQYFRRREIIDAVALVRCILEPEDTLALLTVLRSPLVGAPDAALLPLWREGLPAWMAGLHDADPDALDAIGAIGALAAREAAASGAPGIERVAGWEHLLVEVAAAIGWLRGQYEELPVDRFVAALRERLPLETLSAARYLGEFRVANLQRFYAELVRDLAEGDPQAVLRSLRTGLAGLREAEEARPTDSAERAVRVMTIHKSKGLDFHHVYLVQLHKGRREGMPDDKTVVREWKGGWEYQLFGARTPGYDRVVEHDARIEANERVRLLYVAMTRARDRLVMLGAWDEEPEPVPVPLARNLLELVTARPERPDFREVAQAPVVSGGALWRVPDAEPVRAASAARRDGGLPARPTGEADRRGAAARRMARPISAAASAMAHAGSGFVTAASGDAETRARVAAEVGTAVHLALEHMDAAQPPDAALAAARKRASGFLRTALPAELFAGAETRAHALLAGFVRGPLGERFRAVGAGIVGRELPVLSAPTPQQPPVGFVSGTIDMLYQDPATGEIVVVDYKTDAVRTPEERDARAATYAHQTDVYVRAVQAALDLPTPPRAELWFLAIGEIVGV